MVMCTRRPSSVPSSRSAASTSSVSSRAWPATSRCSLRSSIHFTDRPRSTAAAQHGDVFAGRQHLHAERTADVLRGDARQRDRIAREQPEQHAREVHDAHRLAQERSAPSTCPATPAPAAPRRSAPRRGGVLRRVVLFGGLRDRRGLVGRRHRLGLLQQPGHALALTRDLDQRLPHRLPPGERGQRPLHEVAVLRGRVVLHRADDGVDLGHAPARLHRLVRVAVLHEASRARRGRLPRTRRRRRRSRVGRAAARCRRVRARSPARVGSSACSMVAIGCSSS